ncbi:helix-turn-helix transcriptional regulator [Aneurinibacillus sp. BA2021]|nr:helix-turn-helix transcriptional regulator [Aneurinibacillus sp. BA2021]
MVGDPVGARRDRGRRQGVRGRLGGAARADRRLPRLARRPPLLRVRRRCAHRPHLRRHGTDGLHRGQRLARTPPPRRGGTAQQPGARHGARRGPRPHLLPHAARARVLPGRDPRPGRRRGRARGARRGIRPVERDRRHGGSAGGPPDRQPVVPRGVSAHRDAAAVRRRARPARPRRRVPAGHAPGAAACRPGEGDGGAGVSPAESDEEFTGIHCRLDELLAERGMTLTELSAAVGVSIVNLSVLKNDRARAIRYSTLRAICEALECDVGDLLVLAAR